MTFKTQQSLREVLGRAVETSLVALMQTHPTTLGLRVSEKFRAEDIEAIER